MISWKWRGVVYLVVLSSVLLKIFSWNSVFFLFLLSHIGYAVYVYFKGDDIHRVTTISISVLLLVLFLGIGTRFSNSLLFLSMMIDVIL